MGEGMQFATDPFASEAVIELTAEAAIEAGIMACCQPKVAD